MARPRPAEVPSASRRFAIGVMLVALGVAACRPAPADDALPSDGAMPATGTVRVPRKAPEIPVDAPKVAFLGDSLAAGLHLARDEAFPAVLQRRLAADGLPFHLVNAGVSGSTTAAGRARVAWILDQEPDVVVIELGANDGFRGIAVDVIESDLRAIIRKIRDAGARPLLLGMRLPPNYGPVYAAGFDALFGRVAQEEGVPFVPHFMDGVGGVPEMNLADGIHPTPVGHERLADNVESVLADVLRDL